MKFIRHRNDKIKCMEMLRWLMPKWDVQFLLVILGLTEPFTLRMMVSIRLEKGLEPHVLGNVSMCSNLRLKKSHDRHF